MRHVLALALALPTALVALPAPADDAGPPARLERARVCQAALDYECAEREIGALRGDLDRLPAADRVQALRILAEVALATGRRDVADERLRALLDLKPDFEPRPGAWPPGWVSALDRARLEMPDRLPPELRVDVPAPVRARSPMTVEARVSDRSGVGAVTLFVAGNPELRLPMATSDGQAWTATVPGERIDEPDVAIRVEAFDLAGNGPARWGSPGEPRRVPVSPPAAEPETPLVKQWWLWTVVGAVAIGTGVGIYYLARMGQGSDAGVPGPGRLDVEVRWPAP
jgi:hypothetical protein